MLTKQSIDKKGKLKLMFGEEYSGAVIFIEGEKELDDRDAKVVVEYKYLNETRKDESNYSVWYNGLIHNLNYNKLSFQWYFERCKRLTVYVDKKNICF